MKTPINDDCLEVIYYNLFNASNNDEYVINLFELAKKTIYFTVEQIQKLVNCITNYEIRILIVAKIFPNILDRSNHERLKALFRTEQQYDILIKMINYNYNNNKNEQNIYEDDENFQLYKKCAKDLEINDLIFIEELKEIEKKKIPSSNKNEENALAQEEIEKLKNGIKNKISSKILRSSIGKKTMTVEKSTEILKIFNLEEEENMMDFILCFYSCLKDPQNIVSLLQLISSSEIKNECRANLLNLPNHNFNIYGNEYQNNCCCLIF